MPQKRNPVALEHARAIGSKALGQATAIILSVHNTPFGDIVDTEDDLQPLVAAMFRDALRAVTLVGRGDADRRVRRRAARVAGRGRRHHADRAGGSPRAAARHPVQAGAHDCRPPPRRRIASGRARRSARRWRRCRAICSACRSSTPMREIAEIMSPRHFVDVRTTPGGPAPAETARALARVGGRARPRSRVGASDRRRADRRRSAVSTSGAARCERHAAHLRARRRSSGSSSSSALYAFQQYFS